MDDQNYYFKPRALIWHLEISLDLQHLSLSSHYELAPLHDLEHQNEIFKTSFLSPENDDLSIHKLHT